MDNKILKFIAKQIRDEANYLDLEMYEVTHAKLVVLASLLDEIAKMSELESK